MKPAIPRARVGAPPARGFTLLELLAVVVIIVLLAGIVIGLAGYAKTKAAIGRAKGEIATLENACESFKTDQGRYPTSTIYRTWTYCWWIDTRCETWNSSLLGQQLVAGGYVSPTRGGLTIRRNGSGPVVPLCNTAVNGGWQSTTNYDHVIVDPWETPYSYYCTYPRLAALVATTLVGSCSYPLSTNVGVTNITTIVLTNSVYIGGQKNVSFDLWSLGPNRSNKDGATDDDIGNIY